MKRVITKPEHVKPMAALIQITEGKAVWSAGPVVSLNECAQIARAYDKSCYALRRACREFPFDSRQVKAAQKAVNEWETLFNSPEWCGKV